MAKALADEGFAEKVRRDHDPWHDVANPLKSEEESRRSSSEEALDRLDRIGDKILEDARTTVDAMGNSRMVNSVSFSNGLKDHLIGLDFTDQPAPAPDAPQQPPNGDDVDYPDYEDPHGDMPVDDEEMPPPQGSGGDPPGAPPGGGTLAPVPEDESSDLDMPYDPSNDDGGHSPGGGPLGPGPGHGPSPEEQRVAMEYHDEPPPPGGPPGAVPQFSIPDQVLSPPMPWPAPATPIVPVPIPPHLQFPVPQSLRSPSPRHVAPTRAKGAHLDDVSKAKARAVHPAGPPVALVPGQSTGKKDHEPPVPDADGDSDSDATVDYRENSLLARAVGDEVDKNGYFSKLKAHWVCRGFQDKFAWDQQADSPTATRYGFRLVAQCVANHYWDPFQLDLKTA
ncbi:unnamed protein product, partial [Symbiodinium sp. KB8]